MTTTPTVFVVDDDAALRASLARLMESVGLAVECHPSASAFLASYDPARPGCVLLDIAMPGMSGLELQDELIRRGVHIPVIIISAHGDVEKAVRAMKTGAIDFVRKPCKGTLLLERVRHAIDLDAQSRTAAARRAAVTTLMAQLTPRELEVTRLLVSGLSPKQIAYRLGLSRKTVDVHRGHILAKLNVESLVELVHLVSVLDGAASAASAAAPVHPAPAPEPSPGRA